MKCIGLGLLLVLYLFIPFTFRIYYFILLSFFWKIFLPMLFLLFYTIFSSFYVPILYTFDNLILSHGSWIVLMFFTTIFSNYCISVYIISIVLSSSSVILCLDVFNLLIKPFAICRIIAPQRCSCLIPWNLWLCCYIANKN